MGELRTIGEIAARTGFTSSTLRYYDDIGLVSPSSRSDAGYRRYDDHVLDRLAFIRRAKELGCTINAIRELLVAWDGGRCGPVQEQLRRLVATKIDATSTHISEAEQLLVDLRRSAVALEQHRPDGACDESCGCVDPPSHEPQVDWVTLGRTPEIACSLPSSQLTSRIAEWRTLLETAIHRERIEGGIRIVFGRAVSHDELMRLVTAEQSCCTFFEFAITVDGRGVGLEVRAAPEAIGVVDELFGPVSAAGGGE